MMKQLTYINFFFLFVLSSCLKNAQDCGLSGATVAPEAEKQRVNGYLSSNPDPSAVQLENSGMFYTVLTPGSAKKPSQCSSIGVKYVGRQENGTVFDQTPGTNSRTFTLGGLIEGWRRVLPLIGEGGKVKMYIPPSLAYGPQGLIDPQTGNVVIPPNEIIVFEVELVSVR